jgi:hypothetical protein
MSDASHAKAKISSQFAGERDITPAEVAAAPEMRRGIGIAHA